VYHAGNWILVVLASFLIPILEAALALTGTLYAAVYFKQAPEKFSLLIIQIATVGREYELVQTTINKIRSYGLTMDYQLWVILEPGFRTDYVGADEIIVVPADYTCPPVDKARALHFSWKLRVDRGLDRRDVKIIYVDDDTLPSRRYIELGYAGDYDIAQGPTVPNRWYAIGGWQHFLMSHLDDPRARNCLVYCSTTQGVLGKPLFVHGEGLTITGWTENQIGWDWAIVGSDDLVFGTNAAHQGLKWGYFNAAIQLISPWTWREHLKQRHRWLWGNIDAIKNHTVMPKNYGLAVFIKYIIGFVATGISFCGIAILETGVIVVSPEVQNLFYTSLALWVISYAVPSWIAAGGEPNRELRPQWWRYWGFRIAQTLAGAVMTPITAFAPMIVIIYCYFRGRPDRFVVIDKNNKVVTGI